MSTYRTAFDNQKRNAGKRGIAFRFTYQAWLDWWGDDIDKRGLQSSSLVMARINDEGAYEVSNVRKLTQQLNKLECLVAPSRKRGYHHLIP